MPDGRGGLTWTDWGVCLLTAELLSQLNPALFSPDVLLLIPGMEGDSVRVYAGTVKKATLAGVPMPQSLHGYQWRC